MSCYRACVDLFLVFASFVIAALVVNIVAWFALERTDRNSVIGRFPHIKRDSVNTNNDLRQQSWYSFYPGMYLQRISYGLVFGGMCATGEKTKSA